MMDYIYICLSSQLQDQLVPSVHGILVNYCWEGLIILHLPLSRILSTYKFKYCPSVLYLLDCLCSAPRQGLWLAVNIPNEIGLPKILCLFQKLYNFP